MTDKNWICEANAGFEVGINAALAAAVEGKLRLIKSTMVPDPDDPDLSTYDLNMLRMEQLNEYQGGVADGFFESLYGSE